MRKALSITIGIIAIFLFFASVNLFFQRNMGAGMMGMFLMFCCIAVANQMLGKKSAQEVEAEREADIEALINAKVEEAFSKSAAAPAPPPALTVRPEIPTPPAPRPPHIFTGMEKVQAMARGGETDRVALTTTADISPVPGGYWLVMDESPLTFHLAGEDIQVRHDGELVGRMKPGCIREMVKTSLSQGQPMVAYVNHYAPDSTAAQIAIAFYEEE